MKLIIATAASFAAALAASQSCVWAPNLDPVLSYSNLDKSTGTM